MTQAPKVKGPASYFPSIEKTYGKPTAHWIEILKRAGVLKHMKLVSLLKTEHQLGHGHSNALVAHFWELEAWISDQDQDDHFQVLKNLFHVLFRPVVQ